MENTEENKKSAGCLAYVIGGMSFIPLVGVLFGIVAIIWGFAIKHTRLKIVGVAGIAFTIVLYSSLGYFGFVQEGGVYDDLRSKMAKSQLTIVVQSIELFKVQNGRYPKSLEELQKSLPENSMVFLHDPTQISVTEPKFYYYKLIDSEHYHIRSYGRDGVLNTTDDVLPGKIEKIGLVGDYNPEGAL